MSRSLNKVTLIGHVGADPEIFKTQGGRRVANISLATNNEWIDEKGKKHEDVSWHKCEAWAGLCDVMETWVKKGQQLYIEGRIKYTTGERDGATVHYTCIVIQSFIMLGNSTELGTPKARKAKRDQPQFVPREPSDLDLPF